MKAASLLRKKSIVIQEPFTGSFDENCLSHPVTEVLFTFMNVLLQGSKNSMEETNDDVDRSQRSKCTLTLCQLIMYNMVKYTSLENIKSMLHSKEYETPFPLYWGLKMHTEQRLKIQIDNAVSSSVCENSR